MHPNRLDPERPLAVALPLLILSLITVAPAAAREAAAAEPDAPAWGGFRGANASGTAAEAHLPAQLEVAWEAALPSGYSSPVIAGGKVFATGRAANELFTVALDAATGKELWRGKVEFEGKRPGGNSFAAPTPATDGGRVFALFHHVGMVAYTVDGEELWRNTLGAPYNIPHGLATSPVVHGDVVLVQLDQDGGSALVCLEAATGKERWRTPRESALHSYATPVVHTLPGGAQQVIVSGSYQVEGYDLATGELRWWVTGLSWQSKAVPVFFEDFCIVSNYMPSSTEFNLPRMRQPFEEVLAERDADKDGTIGRKEWDDEALQQTWFIWDLDGNDLLDAKEYAYLQSTQTAIGGVLAIDLDIDGKPLAGDVTGSHVAWRYEGRRGLSDVVSPVLVGGNLFLLKEGGILTALDARTGEVGKQGRVGEPDQYFASPVAADGRILAASLSGQLAVIDASAEWEVLATQALEGKVWSTPALAHGRVYVRAEEKLYCLAQKDE
jgi:outer membrane protein assembly factor BamB